MRNGLRGPKVRRTSSVTRERIALYVPSLNGGGAERVMLDLATGLVDRGIRVDLVLVRAEGHSLISCRRVCDLSTSTPTGPPQVYLNSRATFDENVPLLYCPHSRRQV